MYDHILGEVVDRAAARLVVRAGGVGYELEVPTSTSAALAVGAQAKLFAILHVVDGVPTLLGFAARGERELARRLLGVTGVGKAITLAVLSAYSPAEIAAAILRGDHAMLQRVKGIGAKTAERLCLELRDHVAKLDLGPGAVATAAALPAAAADAIAGLLTLGYAIKDARTKVEREWRRRQDASTEEIIKAVLRG